MKQNISFLFIILYYTTVSGSKSVWLFRHMTGITTAKYYHINTELELATWVDNVADVKDRRTFFLRWGNIRQHPQRKFVQVWYRETRWIGYNIKLANLLS